MSFRNNSSQYNLGCETHQLSNDSLADISRSHENISTSYQRGISPSSIIRTPFHNSSRCTVLGQGSLNVPKFLSHSHSDSFLHSTTPHVVSNSPDNYYDSQRSVGHINNGSTISLSSHPIASSPNNILWNVQSSDQLYVDTSVAPVGINNTPYLSRPNDSNFFASESSPNFTPEGNVSWNSQQSIPREYPRTPLDVSYSSQGGPYSRSIRASANPSFMDFMQPNQRHPFFQRAPGSAANDVRHMECGMYRGANDWHTPLFRSPAYSPIVSNNETFMPPPMASSLLSRQKLQLAEWKVRLEQDILKRDFLRHEVSQLHDKIIAVNHARPSSVRDENNLYNEILQKNSLLRSEVNSMRAKIDRLRESEAFPKQNMHNSLQSIATSLPSYPNYARAISAPLQSNRTSAALRRSTFAGVSCEESAISKSVDVDLWRCDKCQFDNSSLLSVCEICELSRYAPMPKDVRTDGDNVHVLQCSTVCGVTSTSLTSSNATAGKLSLAEVKAQQNGMVCGSDPHLNMFETDEDFLVVERIDS